MLPANVGERCWHRHDSQNHNEISCQQQVLDDGSPEGLRMTALARHYDLQQITA